MEYHAGYDTGIPRAPIAYLALLLSLLAGAAAASEDFAIEKGRRAAEDLTGSIHKRLSATMRESGPAGAVYTCAYQAQAVVDDVANKQGVSAKRTSLKLRNPENAPDDYEKQVLARFEALQREGSLPDERVEPIREGGAVVYRYVRPILVENLCLSCHGAPDQIPEDVRKVLESNYPGDRATGYAAGDFRGIVSIIVRTSPEK